MKWAYSFVYDAVWCFRAFIAKRLVSAAHALDEDVGIDMYRGEQCQIICLKIWRKELTQDQARGEIYAALY